MKTKILKYLKDLLFFTHIPEKRMENGNRMSSVIACCVALK